MSADIRGSAARSSSATDALSDTSDLGTLARNGISSVIIASEWHFKPAGVMEVEKRFAEKRDRMRADGYIQWLDQDHHFKLSSERHLIPLLEELYQITKAIIVQERGDREADSEDDEEEEEEEEEEDTRSEWSTEFQSDLIVKVDEYEPSQHTRSPNPASDDTFYPDTIKKYSYRDIWVYPGEKLIDEFLKLPIVLELQTLTNSKIVKSPSQSKVYIGSYKHGSVDLVIHKINNIAKYSSIYAPQYHIFYTEEVESCKFIIKAFPEIKKKYLETTLFEQEYPAGYLLTKFTVRACPWSTAKVTFIPIKIGKYTPAVPSPGTQISATKPWAGFVWKSRGSPEDDPVKYFPGGYKKEIERQEKEDAKSKEDISSTCVDIEGWVANATTTTDASKGLDILDWRGTIDTSLNSLARLAMASEPDSNVTNEKPNAERWNPSIHQETTAKLSMHPTPAKYGGVPSELERNLSNGELSPDRVTTKPSTMQSCLLDSAIDAELANFDWNALRHNATENTLVDVSSSPTRSPNLRIFDTTHGSDALGDQQFLALEPPALPSSLRSLALPQLPSEELESLMGMAPVSMIDSTSNPSDEFLSSMAFPELPGSKPSLISPNNWPILPSPQSVGSSKSKACRENQLPQPRRQQEDETTTRVFHRTMGQKASIKKEVTKLAIVLMLQESFLKNFEVLLSGLMSPVRGFRGEVKVHIDFGRILLGNLPVKIVSKEEQNKPYDEDSITPHLYPSLGGKLREGDGPEVTFTNILTALEADTTFLLNLKNNEGVRLWSEKCSEWKVTYEFTCLELRTDKLFTIEIDAETFETHIVVLKRCGGTYVHGTMRHWDLQLHIEGIEDEEDIRSNWPGFDDLATEMQQTLYIPPGNHKPNHALKLPKHIMDQFIIYHLKIRKTRSYISPDGNSKLNITEVDKSRGHELQVKDQGILVYVFQEEKRDFNVETNWQEVSITSVAIDKLLEQNMTLELGEEVQWTLQDLAAKKVSNALIKPACAMLAQMDGVGFYNDVQDLGQVLKS
ncbi:uncharacterized protein EAF01_008405 [Botrytis porri]|uniref:Uncharacterized protein n=1 Tax=Botrytis porri TaxID=87229 RepID=A0A4Z1KXI2_9HELO|nr:uncharacterized protein EAF01_008405 [Botrytis porri]KAF7899192.1 hypothetical protein EAF01_008405 [Botrytis porri]TGO89222.1 hypothetical protein BPOR_0119g00090 [Botrytis porri]